MRKSSDVDGEKKNSTANLRRSTLDLNPKNKAEGSTSIDNEISNFKNLVRAFCKKKALFDSQDKFTPEFKALEEKLEYLHSKITLYYFDDKKTRLKLQEEISNFTFHSIFRAIIENPEDKQRDEEWSSAVSKYEWITPSHLEIATSQYSSNLWDQAKKELLLLNFFVLPSQKLIAILNASKILIYLIQNSEGKAASADDFLPHLIFVVLNSHLKHLHSNCKFILWTSKQSSTTDQNGETWYFFTHFYSALLWISGGIKHDSLRITKEEYERFTGSAPPSSPTEASTPLALKGLDRTQSKKALKVLGVDMSKEKAMKKLGIDEKTAAKLQDDIFTKKVTKKFIEGQRGLPPPFEELASPVDRFPFLNRTPESISEEDVRLLLDNYKQVVAQLLRAEAQAKK